MLKISGFFLMHMVGSLWTLINFFIYNSSFIYQFFHLRSFLLRSNSTVGQRKMFDLMILGIESDKTANSSNDLLNSSRAFFFKYERSENLRESSKE